MTPTSQFGRKATLVVSQGEVGLDLSELRFTFRVSQGDVQSPNNARIKIYNLADTTSDKIRKEFSRVTLQAGYESSFGIIFDGTIKQFYKGRENATDKFLEILAAEADIGYNFGVVNASIAAGSSLINRVNAAASAMGVGVGDIAQPTGGVLPRGKVLFGMARDLMRQEAASQVASWTIQDGKVQVTSLTGYRPGEAVVLNSGSGMVGIPEATEEGVRVSCLLNPKLRVGTRFQINQNDINQIIQQNPDAAPIPFNQWTGLQLLASVAQDGFYRLFVVEHEGDTRGQQWNSHLIGLSINQALQQVKPYG